MIFNEQKYSNLYRSYYHGSSKEVLSLENARFPYFFLTTKPIYAIYYAKNENGEKGFVHECRIRQPLNIFNILSNMDRNRLNNYLKQKRDDLSIADKEKLFKELESYDWLSGIRNIELSRKELVQYIIEMRYDGFFNYESPNRNEYLVNSPTIGIFNIDNIVQVQTYSSDQFNKIDKNYDKIREKEIDDIENKVRMLYKGFSREELETLILDDTILFKSDIFPIMDKIWGWYNEDNNHFQEQMNLFLYSRKSAYFKNKIKSFDFINQYNIGMKRKL